MAVFVNRTLNLKKIKLIGFDMDYTLVPYDTKKFEQLTHTLAVDRLVTARGYPESVRTLTFDFSRAIVGLVVDKRHGNLLQLNRYNKVKASYHGLKEVPFKEQNELYRYIAVDLHDKDFQSLDTSFAISYGVLFGQLVQMKEDGEPIPDYRKLADDILTTIDDLHRDGSLKTVLKNNFPEYVIQDPDTAMLLERYKDYGKKLMIITNSDYEYSRALLDYALNPFLKTHDKWQDVFDLVVTLADKPRFFERQSRFLAVDPETGLMRNQEAPLIQGIYQGGWYGKLQEDMGLAGEEILYIGDHIYGDVVSIKKQCDWRTALVLGDLEEEMKGLEKSFPIQQEIDSLMNQKLTLEQQINQIDIERYLARNMQSVKSLRSVDPFFREMDGLNSRISELIGEYKKCFNPYWGEILRAGSEESLYAEQVEEYACIYMTRVSDLSSYSPRTYFRPIKRIMPHELAVAAAMEKEKR
jgi:HAD superfamily 5'-nucleotidase-like hydrolase